MFLRFRSFVRTHWLLIAIVSIGAVARLWHLSFGLPQTLLEDEEFFITPALRIAEDLTHFTGWDPGWYGAPAAPLISLLAVVFRCIAVVLNALQHTHLTVHELFSVHTTLFVTCGRLIPVAAGVVTIIALYHLGALYSRAAGLWAAALYALAFYPIQYSHIIRPDVMQGLFIVLSVYCLARVLREPYAHRWYVFLGIAYGLACVTKYPSAFIAPVLCGVALVTVYRTRALWTMWLEAALVMVLTMFCAAPFVFLHFDRALANVLFESVTQHPEQMGLSFTGNFAWYMGNVLPWQLGTGLCITALVGAVVALYRKESRGLGALLCVVFLSYIFGTSAHNLHWERWCIPLTTLACIAAGIGVSSIVALKWRGFQWACIVLLCAAPLLRTARTLAAYTQPHTVQMAQRWIVDNVAHDAFIIREPYTPELPEFLHVETVANAAINTTRWYKTHDVEYVVIGAVYERITRLAQAENAQASFVGASERYTQLQERMTTVFALPPYPQHCFYAPDWTVLLRHDCARPFFGEGQYVLRVNR